MLTSITDSTAPHLCSLADFTAAPDGRTLELQLRAAGPAVGFYNHKLLQRLTVTERCAGYGLALTVNVTSRQSSTHHLSWLWLLGQPKQEDQVVKLILRFVFSAAQCCFPTSPSVQLRHNAISPSAHLKDKSDILGNKLICFIVTS